MQIKSITPKWQQQAAGGSGGWGWSSARVCSTAVLSRTALSSASPTAIFLWLHYSRTNILTATKLHLLLRKSSHRSKAWFSWARKTEVLGRRSHMRQKAVVSVRENMVPPQLCLIRARKTWETHCSPLKEQHFFLSEMFISISTPQSGFLMTGVFMGVWARPILWTEKGDGEWDHLTQRCTWLL